MIEPAESPYIEARIALADEDAELVQGILFMHGIDCFELCQKSNLNEQGTNWDYIEPSVYLRFKEEYLQFALPDSAEARLFLLMLQSRYGYNISERRVLSAEWRDEWKKFYKPIEVGERLVIRPEWEIYTGDIKTECIIEPANVFGTGLHQSTRLCLTALTKYVCGGETVLDIGCGTGILAVSALLLGAKEAYLTDVDPSALAACERNMGLNQFTGERWRYFSGDISSDHELFARIRRERFQVITANIVAEVIMRLSEPVGCILAPDGVFIVSGIIEDRAEQVKRFLTAAGWTIREESCADNWKCFVCARSGL